MGAVGTPLRHEAAHLHVTGRAVYVDDIPLPANTLHAAFGLSPVARGNLRALDLTDVLASEGVVAIATAADIPGHNNYGGIVPDDPVFAGQKLDHAGQPMFAVAATSHRVASRAAKQFRADIETLPAILDIRAALAAESYVIPSQTLRRGEPDRALEASAHRLTGTMVCGGQDHLYLEGQIAIAIPGEDGQLLIHCSTQHPTEIQHVVSDVLARPMQDITVQCRRMGGGFGGKESQSALLAAAAAVLAAKTGRPVKLRLDRDADMLITGKRHDFLADYEVGFDERGVITGLKVMLASRCGHSADLSGPVNDRAVCHVDNAYFLEHVEIVSHRCRTNTVSNTAFRGFGGPQGMLVIEQVIDDIARSLKLDPLTVRRRNYYGLTARNVTPYGQTVEDNVLDTLTDQLEASSGYRARRREISTWNAANPVIKRGIALTPVKFGISFNATFYNQAGALLHVYKDGSVAINHGGTEMGQGLHTKIIQIVAQELGLPVSAVRITATDTGKVPNTSATAASSGSDLNGKAAQAAARTIRARLVAWLCTAFGVGSEQVCFDNGVVHVGERMIAFADVVDQAYHARVQLSATGYYRTPKIHWDRSSFTGRPFFYFGYGVSVSEVAVDTLTGETRLLRVDLLHDAGSSLNPALDRGQIEGGYLQGYGWLTTEELHWNRDGQLKTHAPSTYKIPTARDWPADARVALLAQEPNCEDTIHRSKAVGEPPLMLAFSALHAIRDAVAACGDGTRLPVLPAPATPETVLRAISAIRGEVWP